MRDKVDVVLISHPHPDHTGSLCTLAIVAKLFYKKKLLIGGWDVAGIFKETGIFELEEELLSVIDEAKLFFSKE